jgi:hypothetical protein
MSWTTLTSDELLPYLAAAQLNALQTKALGTDQTDPTPTLMSDIAKRVRALVASGGWAISATSDTLPALLHGPAAALVVELAQTRIPGFSLTTEQTRQADQARDLLAKIASGLVAVETPTDPDTTLSVGKTLRGSGRPERVDGRQMKGL